MSLFDYADGDRGRFFYRAPDPQAGQEIPHVVTADLAAGWYEQLRLDPHAPQAVGNETFLFDSCGVPLRRRCRRPFLFFREGQAEEVGVG